MRPNRTRSRPHPDRPARIDEMLGYDRKCRHARSVIVKRYFPSVETPNRKRCTTPPIHLHDISAEDGCEVIRQDRPNRVVERYVLRIRSRLPLECDLWNLWRILLITCSLEYPRWSNRSPVNAGRPVRCKVSGFRSVNLSADARPTSPLYPEHSSIALTHTAHGPKLVVVAERPM